ncbi:unnamed protein product [Paramecium sonneborni]|uniref:H-type lectin domain-containing protein n=1 Tax=Paramecium sonneborni TaxID=65129 RepID=A0A8S1LW42_9CILI|nr:unnamed protein product [Paramecium sonneborni]
MFTSFIVLIILDSSFGFIKYDTGLLKVYDYEVSSFNCQNGFSKTATINFAGTFENQPQVFFYLEKIDLERAELEFKLSITTITVTSFQTLISCAKYRVYRTQIRWFAIDDQRIEVINNFNMINPDDKTFQIKNPNAQYGFLTLTSIHFTGQIDFQLSISSITTNSATVTITKVSGKFANLKQIGYQLVVGVQEAFINLGLMTPTGGFSSGALPIQTNRWFFIALQGLNYNYADNIRIETLFTNTATTLSYTFGAWQGVTETPNRHSQIWIAYQFTYSYKALECFSVRTSRREAFDLTILPPIYLELVSLNQIYTTIGNYNYIINKSVQPVNIVILLGCPNGKKVKAEFNKCNSCSTQKFYSITYNCFNKMNYVGFYPVFKQAFQQYNQLKINMQSSSLEITQVLYDQKITEQLIIKVQILNQ